MARPTISPEVRLLDSSPSAMRFGDHSVRVLLLAWILPVVALCPGEPGIGIVACVIVTLPPALLLLTPSVFVLLYPLLWVSGQLLHWPRRGAGLPRRGLTFWVMVAGAPCLLTLPLIVLPLGEAGAGWPLPGDPHTGEMADVSLDKRFAMAATISPPLSLAALTMTGLALCLSRLVTRWTGRSAAPRPKAGLGPIAPALGLGFLVAFAATLAISVRTGAAFDVVESLGLAIVAGGVLFPLMLPVTLLWAWRRRRASDRASLRPHASSGWTPTCSGQ